MKLLLFSVLIFLLCSCSDNAQDTSPLYNIEGTTLEPINDLINAVLVYQSLKDSLPPDFQSLAALSREDWIKAGRTKMVSRDTIVVGNIESFSEDKSFVEKTETGFRVLFQFKNQSSYWTYYEEALYSKDFDTFFSVEYDISIHIDKGSGIIEMNFDKNGAVVQIDTLVGLMWPVYRTAGDSKEINLINKSFTFEINDAFILE